MINSDLRINVSTARSISQRRGSLRGRGRCGRSQSTRFRNQDLEDPYQYEDNLREDIEEYRDPNSDDDNLFG